ncbi:hypothetical protein J2810_003569 [Chryseobacterium rhizosphaerae]|nr:hypothetical protein [Chryseobacterium rhizosphaerae]
MSVLYDFYHVFEFLFLKKISRRIYMFFLNLAPDLQKLSSNMAVNFTLEVRKQVPVSSEKDENRLMCFLLLNDDTSVKWIFASLFFY